MGSITVSITTSARTQPYSAIRPNCSRVNFPTRLSRNQTTCLRTGRAVPYEVFERYQRNGKHPENVGLCTIKVQNVLGCKGVDRAVRAPKHGGRRNVRGRLVLACPHARAHRDGESRLRRDRGTGARSLGPRFKTGLQRPLTIRLLRLPELLRCPPPMQLR